MRYRFVLQLDRSPDDDETCETAEEVRTDEVVVVAPEATEADLSTLFDELGAVLERELARRRLAIE